MSVLDLNKFDATELRREPCDFIIVPGFVESGALEGLNADFPAIPKPGNFPLEELTYGPRFKALIDELTGPAVRKHFAEKFGMDLDSYPTQVTVRKFMSSLDGNVHNDSSSKKITVLIYFNDEWTQPGGQLRITKSIDSVDDYYAEVPPVGGNLIAFRRNERSFHGFPSASGERRSLQMYWVEPRRIGRKKDKGVFKAFHKILKRKFGIR